MVMASAPRPPTLTDGIGGLEPAVGIEPTTCCLQDSCSAPELRRRPTEPSSGEPPACPSAGVRERSDHDPPPSLRGSTNAYSAAAREADAFSEPTRPRI